MSVKDLLADKYGKRGIDETPNTYIKKCVKELEQKEGFNKAHEILNAKFKQRLEGKQYVDTCVYITGNENEYARALSSI